MISAGKNITSSTDLLQRLSVKHLYDALVHPKSEIEAKLRLLRSVRSIDIKRYALLKRQLPYIVCGLFNPSFRRLDNFAYTNYFILDFDHLSDKEMNPAGLKERLKADPNIHLCFLSPSEDGLKVMFRLAEPCYDKGLYATFYKVFATRFARRYGIEQVLDASTSDASRACFISMDAEAYYNPESENVVIRQFIDEQNTMSVRDALHEAEKQIATAESTIPKLPKDSDSKEPDKETMLRIREIISPRLVQVKPLRDIHVPERLDEIMEQLKEFVQANGIMVTNVSNIQYAKKIQLQLNLQKAEINLFYGKKGFSVVQSPRSGTSPELNQLAADIIQLFINEHCY